MLEQAQDRFPDPSGAKPEPPKNTYSGLHAAHYDRIYEDKPYAQEAAFVARLLRQHGRDRDRLLDLACGTGRHAREFAGMGWDVTGVDYSEELLAVARTNAPEVTFHCRDITTLELGGRFDAITCLFDSIGFPQTDEGVLGVLAAARAHLRSAGTLIVEFLHATAMRRYAEPTRTGRWPMPDGGELVRISRVELDRASDVMHASYQLFDVGPDGTPRAYATDELAQRFFTVEGMQALMRRADMRVVECVSAYAERDRIDDSVWHVLMVAKPEYATT